MNARDLIRRPLYRLYEQRLVRSLDAMPRHIGVIHDGHRRFARESGLPDYRGPHGAWKCREQGRPLPRPSRPLPNT